MLRDAAKLSNGLWSPPSSTTRPACFRGTASSNSRLTTSKPSSSISPSSSKDPIHLHPPRPFSINKVGNLQKCRRILRGRLLWLCTSSDFALFLRMWKRIKLRFDLPGRLWICWRICVDRSTYMSSLPTKPAQNQWKTHQKVNNFWNRRPF